MTDSREKKKTIPAAARGDDHLYSTRVQSEIFLKRKKKKETCAATRNYVNERERAATRPIAARSVHKVKKKRN